MTIYDFTLSKILEYKLLRLYTTANVMANGTSLLIGTLKVPSLIEINKGSWKFLVLRTHCFSLESQLSREFPSSEIDLNYDPTQPETSCVESWGYNGAWMLNRIGFSARAQKMIEEALGVAALYYAYLDGRLEKVV